MQKPKYKMSHPYWCRTELYRSYRTNEIFYDSDNRCWKVLAAECDGGYWHLDLERMDK